MKKEHHISTIGSVYDKPNISYFEQYIDYIATEHEEVPDYLIPLNPPPVPMLIQDEYNASFMQHFEAATNYILYAATACTRLRVGEEIARRSRLRWYSVLADLYDRYKEVVNQIPSLKDDDRRVREASELDGKKKDKLKRKALAKEVMAGRRINKILTALKGQWHVIELHDFITREFLINNDTDFFDKLTRGIQWPMKVFSLPYKRVPNSGSSFQFALLKDYDEMYYDEVHEDSEDHEGNENHEKEDDNDDGEDHGSKTKNNEGGNDGENNENYEKEDDNEDHDGEDHGSKTKNNEGDDGEKKENQEIEADN
jgi:hypothetical protein